MKVLFCPFSKYKEIRITCTFDNRSLKDEFLFYVLNTARKVSNVAIFFWSVFSRIRTKYGVLLCKSPFSSRIQKYFGQKKNCKLGHFSSSSKTNFK